MGLDSHVRFSDVLELVSYDGKRSACSQSIQRDLAPPGIDHVTEEVSSVLSMNTKVLTAGRWPTMVRTRKPIPSSCQF